MKTNVLMWRMLMNTREIEMNSNYWDCECNTNYIHSKKKESYCSVCKVYEFDQPDSREEEVGRMQKKEDADED